MSSNNKAREILVPSPLSCRPSHPADHSTVIGQVCTHNQNEFALRPLLVTVCFRGALPGHLVNQQIPIHVSVAVGEEYQSFTTPVVEDISWDVCNSEHSLRSDEFTMEEDFDFEEPHPDVPIPFLPLPADFDSSSFQDWKLLSQKIESWLVSAVPVHSQQWTWGRDTFWLAFVAAHPSFPGGRWPMWNSNIPLEGEFIEGWINDGGGLRGPAVSGKTSIRQCIWAEFS